MQQSTTIMSPGGLESESSTKDDANLMDEVDVWIAQWFSGLTIEQGTLVGNTSAAVEEGPDIAEIGSQMQWLIGHFRFQFSHSPHVQQTTDQDFASMMRSVMRRSVPHGADIEEIIRRGCMEHSDVLIPYESGTRSETAKTREHVPDPTHKNKNHPKFPEGYSKKGKKMKNGVRKGKKTQAKKAKDVCILCVICIPFRSSTLLTDTCCSSKYTAGLHDRGSKASQEGP